MIGEIISKIIVFFEEHHTIRKVLKEAFLGGLATAITIIIAAETQLLATMPEYAFVIVILMAGLTGLLNKIKHMKR